MRTGTEPWVVAKTIMSACSQIIGFFSLYYSARGFPSVCLAALALLSPIAGGLAWHLLNRINGWPFYLGGPINEPYGLYAVVWGGTTILPVALAVTLATTKADLNSISAIAQWFVSREFGMVLVCSALAGAFSMLLYGPTRKLGARTLISGLGWRHERTEQAMIVLWAVALAGAPALAVLILGGPSSVPRSMPHLLLYTAPAVVASILCLLALAAYFGFYDYLNLDKKAQIRGLIAGYVVRLGLFWGTWIIIDAGNFHQLKSIVAVYLNSPFS